MQINPPCLVCIKSNMHDLVCTAYPKAIPWRILHGAGCDSFQLNPEAPPPPDASLDLDNAAKHPK